MVSMVSDNIAYIDQWGVFRFASKKSLNQIFKQLNIIFDKITASVANHNLLKISMKSWNIAI